MTDSESTPLVCVMCVMYVPTLAHTLVPCDPVYGVLASPYNPDRVLVWTAIMWHDCFKLALKPQCIVHL